MVNGEKVLLACTAVAKEVASLKPSHRRETLVKKEPPNPPCNTYPPQCTPEIDNNINYGIGLNKGVSG